MSTPSQGSSARTLGTINPDDVKATVDEYAATHDAGLERRKENYQSFVTS